MRAVQQIDRWSVPAFPIEQHRNQAAAAEMIADGEVAEAADPFAGDRCVRDDVPMRGHQPASHREVLGGPAALVATPVQKVAGSVARTVNAPVRFWAYTVNNAVDTVKHAGEETSDRFSAVTDRAVQLTEAVRETLTAGRSASLRRAEQIARREGNKDAAKAARTAREELGDVSADELPIKNFDQLSVGELATAVSM